MLAIGVYAAIAFWSDARRFAAALAGVGPAVAAALLALSLANYALRAARWRLFLARLGHAVPASAAMLNYASGFALTTTPGKAGEAIRSLQLRRNHGVPVTDSLAAFFAERFSDVMALALLAALALSRVPHGAWAAAAIAATVAIALWVAACDARSLALGRMVGAWLPHRYAAPVTALVGQAGRLTRGWALAIGLAISVGAWLAEGYALHLIAAAMGAGLDAPSAIGIYAAALLGGALFFLPGGLGSTEALMFLLLSQSGMDAATAGAATVLSRVTTLWFAVALGWIALPFATRPVAGG